ncbi:MAG: hypothetical protein LBK66_09755 [Spirochaetaceae bacterium]|jgi:hypothetical protein|nr:hypothetical protein [Spirochaetaceae bacterium]
MVHRFIVFVPHANVCAEFNKYRRTLFACGYGGAYSFPAASPIALVKKPASISELKSMAALFRQRSYDGAAGGKMQTELLSSIYLPDGKIITGPCLSIDAPPLPESITLIESFPKLILGAGIFSVPPVLPQLAPPLKFSAAALANMTFQALGCEASYSWTIGALQWLPPVNKRSRI